MRRGRSIVAGHRGSGDAEGAASHLDLVEQTPLPLLPENDRPERGRHDPQGHDGP